jgi:endo-1,4-beta-xylanase
LVFTVVAALIAFISCKENSRQPNENDTITSLYKTYEKLFRVGTALSDWAIDDSLTVYLTKKHFNAITAENSMKWEYIHPKPGLYEFKSSDKFVDFGERNGMYIVGHVLVWHSQTPKWVFTDNSGNKVSRDTLLKRMQDHIYTVVGRYKGRVHCWDVVNEAINDEGTIRKNLWYEIIGIDYVQKAFEFTKEADSSATLIYNDYSLSTPVKREGVVKLISELKSKGVKIDGIGMQAHYHLDFPKLSDLEESIVAFANLGCKVMITEMDINVLPRPQDYEGADVGIFFQYDSINNPYPEALPDSMQKILANRYSAFFKIFLLHSKSIDRVTLWGVQDSNSWLNEWPVRGRSNYPLLFNNDYQPKQAFWALVNLTKGE